MPVNSCAERRPIVVLDTNVTLDWLLFGDPRTTALALAVTQGVVDWIVCPSMRVELVHTLSYPVVSRRLKASVQSVMTRFDTLSRVTAEPPDTAPQHPICRDPDDQVFVDLALVHQATWLLSHDKMVRELARRAAAWGLWIGPPESGDLPTSLRHHSFVAPWVSLAGRGLTG